MTRIGISIGRTGGAAQAAVLSLVVLTGCAMPGDNEAARGPKLGTVPGYAAAMDAGGALVVMRTEMPFGAADGAEAKRAANQICGGAVASSINDTFRDGAWIFPDGCGHAA